MSQRKMAKRSTLRLVDANANRALEGVRVCEEIVRFHLEAPALFGALRTLRHAIARAVRQLPVSPVELVRSRDSRRDIGRRASSDPVGSLERLLLINLQRTKEALRVLEECARLLPSGQSRVFQRLRFHTYDAERDLLRRLAALRHR